MPIQFISPKKAVNSAYLKLPISIEKMDTFKTSLKRMADQGKPGETEEYHKGLINKFLSDALYNPDYAVNTKDRIDLAIFNGKDTNAKAAVLIEVKSPENTAEMFSDSHFNVKALQELVYYFMQEYIRFENHEIKYLVITNYNDWYVFNAKDFVKFFAVKSNPVYDQFKKFDAGQMSSSKTDFFYGNIAKPSVEKFLETENIQVVHFNLKKVITAVEQDKTRELAALYKFLSPETLLAKPFANDSNSLDKNFYAELLHIIGLEEVKEDGKKVIRRKEPKNRDKASLLESAIYQLEIDEPDAPKREEMALRLCITWVNRLLFLKLVESQILMYQKGDSSYKFMSLDKIKSFDELNIFFFKVLGKKIDDRDKDIQKKYPNVPYLNSSLFEPTDDETKLKIRGIPDDDIEIFNKTVLKDEKGKRAKGTLQNLDYIFKFLDAYNFASDAQGGVSSTNKTLINASVLGLIFEKINGYKDGSFYTPGFITDYMAKDVLERAVIQKFNETKEWNCKNIEDVEDSILEHSSIKEANDIVNDIRIADVAVGSGHFLVSTLNHLLAIKSKLNILCDADGNKISKKRWQLKVENDELSVVDDDGEPFEYKPKNEELQRIQKGLFNEKRNIIENCLFGVDLNPNSVNICRLRLWIELLKNAYYTEDSGFTRLETLPNIDINIKVGDSLLSKYPVQNGRAVLNFLQDTDKSDKKNGLAAKLRNYRENVQNYKKGGKDFDKRQIRLNINGLKAQLKEPPSIDLFGNVVKTNDIDFSNSMEWMFEFPEILDDEGKFVGFDVVVGNPPYGLFNKKQNQKVALQTKNDVIELVRKRYPAACSGMINAANVFYELGLSLSKLNGFVSMIVPFGIMSSKDTIEMRKFLLYQNNLIKVDAFPERDSVSRRVFEDAKTSTAIILTQKRKGTSQVMIGSSYEKKIPSLYSSFTPQQIKTFDEKKFVFPLCNTKAVNLINHLRKDVCKNISLGSIAPCITGELDMSIHKSFLSDNENELAMVKGVQIDSYRYKTKNEEISQGKIEFAKESFLDKCSEEKKSEYKKSRIALQGLSGVNEKRRIKAMIVPEKTILANSCNYLKSQDQYSLKFILALMNSSLFNFVFKATSTSSNVNGYEIDALPFKILDSVETVEELEVLADQIIAAKKTGEDTLALEAQVNAKVYELYGITDPEEIASVEGLT
ncbi:MAG: Eco57I restriction-modification methylase domain-containing protein [Candidatus Saccharibacteria bacterium]|nr:Eco57I restriction-modification methylase domain-containing protein [Candidatus Saccharibacteria bacterium]